MKLSLVVLAFVSLLACSRNQQKESLVSASFHAEELAPNHRVDLSQRKVFPFSVVPGGTINKEEVKAGVAADPVVREHYKGIELDKLKPYRLTQPARGYVSYRIGNRIFWTAQRLYLKAGEILLSDGIHMLRGRCGNRVSLEARLPILIAAEPKEAVLDLPSWDAPLFQAMVREANLGDSYLPLLLPGNGPQALISIYTDLPAAIFAVAPPVGPGLLGGVLPGALPPTQGDYGLTIYNTPPIVYVSAQPILLPPPSILLPPITPIQLVLNFGPPGFVNGGPIGFGNPPFGFVEIPIFPGLLLPPLFLFPPTVSGGSPPIVVAGPAILPPGGVVLPPGESHPPPTGPPGVPTPPETTPPPAFEPIPEPSTLWLVSAAAVALLLLKRKR